MTELDIKILIAKEVIKNCSDFIIGAEVPFQFGERRADIATLESGYLTAFEIKGTRDNIDRLGYQIESYKRYFDYCYIVCEPENLKEVRRHTPTGVGIYVAHEKWISKARKSKLFKKHDKLILTSALSSSTLKKIVCKKFRSNIEMCQYASQYLTLAELRKISREEFRLKYEVASKLFKMEATQSVNADDIYTITKKSPSELNKRTAT